MISEREELLNPIVIDGRPYTLRLIQSPLIDDVVISETQIAAFEVAQGIKPTERRVDRGVRDYLIRLRVER